MQFLTWTTSDVNYTDGMCAITDVFVMFPALPSTSSLLEVALCSILSTGNNSHQSAGISLLIIIHIFLPGHF